jgi:hypothetical protein
LDEERLAVSDALEASDGVEDDQRLGDGVNPPDPD